MNTPIKTVANSQTATPTNYHKMASFVGNVGKAVVGGVKVASQLPGAFVKNVFGDPYGASLKSQGFGKKHKR